MFFGHIIELTILLVMLLTIGGTVGLVWLFGLAVGRGIAREQRDC
jgi:hypothetical protein